MPLTPYTRRATLLASAARTASNDTADQRTPGDARGFAVTINVTAASATPSVVFTIQRKDPVSGAYSTVLASAAITGVGTTVLRVYPGLTAAANLTANDLAPDTWRVSIAHADGDSITYSVGVEYFP